MTTRFPLYWCHSCQSEVYPLRVPQPTCPNCHSEFVEQIEETDDPRELHTGDDIRSEASHSQTTDNPDWNFFGFGRMGHYHSDSRSNTFEDGNDDYYDSNPDESGHIHHNFFGYRYDDSARSRPSRSRTTNIDPSEEFANMLHSSLRRWLGPNSSLSIQVPYIAESTSTGDRNAQEESASEPGGNRRPRGQWQFHSFGAEISPNQGTPQQANFGSFIQQLFAGAGMPFPFFPVHGNPNDYAHNQSALDDIISQLMEQHASRNAPPPTPEDTIKSLPYKKVTKDDIEQELECAVCKENFKIGEEIMMLPCAHRFHCDCIRPWLNLNSTCPTCRHSLI